MRSSRIDRSFGTVSQVIFLLLLLVSLTLSGCGGGGGGASTPAPQDEMPPQQDEMPPQQDEMPPPQDEMPPPQEETPPPQDEMPPPQDETPPPVQRTPQQPVQRTPQQPVQQSPPPQTQQPPPARVTCVSTSEGCLSETQYKARVKTLEETHEKDRGFSNQWGLNTVKADKAWSQLQLKRGASTAPGDGITLGAIDTGIDENHPAFVGKTVIEVFRRGATNENGEKKNSHGTSVAGVMVAKPSPDFISRTKGALGVAWGADITMFAIRTGTGGTLFTPISL